MTRPDAYRDPLVGARIDGRYAVHGILGRGGMGVVYHGVHEQLGRPVAIKVLGAAIANDPVSVERFLREARTASTLTHGNIVDVSDLGQLPDGRPYLVMPRMEGEDLAHLMATRGPQTPERTLELLRGAASALDLIHAKGYVHRDVKPENMMHVVREDGSEAVLLLDFGIVALVAKQAARLTTDGSIFGTPAYLPPEAIHQEDPDRRADVYALAAVAFELMTGRLPIEAETPRGLLKAKTARDAPPMSSVCDKRFSPELEAVIAKGLARDPNQRYGSAGGFIQGFEAALEAGEAVIAATLAYGVPPPERGKDQDSVGARHTNVDTDGRTQTLRRRKGASVAGAGLLLAVGVTWWLLESPPPEPPAPNPRLSEVAPVPPPAARPANRSATTTPTSVPAPAPPEASPAPARAPEVEPSPPLPEAASAARPSGKGRDKPPRPQPAVKPPAPAPTPPPAPSNAPGAAARAEELNKQATQALMQGRLARADELYAQATREDPRSFAAFRGLGLTSERLGRTQEAIRAFRRALQLAPQGAQADSIRARLDKLVAAE